MPATIAIINGFPKIGLTPSELKLLAEPASEVRAAVIKASRRDVAYACAHRLTAGKRRHENGDLVVLLLIFN